MIDRMNRAPPDGWESFAPPDTFGALAGPIYRRNAASAEPGVGFWADARHQNLAGVAHGGALLTLADMALFDIVFRSSGPMRAVTVSLNADFVRAAPLGSFIEASGEPVRIGGALLTARGLIRCKGEIVVSFSGTLKRLADGTGGPRRP